MSRVLNDVRRCFDEFGCTGLTLWVEQGTNRIQANMRRSDKVSWLIEFADDPDEAIEAVAEEFIRSSRPTHRPRKVVQKKKPRDLSDLL